MSGGSHTAEVKTFSSSDKFGIILAHPCTSKKAKEAIAQRLKLKPQSLALFGLFIGPLGQPRKILEDADTVPIGADLSFHRWSFDLAKEAKLMRQDDMALHLLYCEAKHYYQEGTKLRPSAEKAAELDSYMDPDFPVERQFMEAIHSVPGYGSYTTLDCILKEKLVSNSCNLEKDTVVRCCLNMEKMALLRGNDKVIEWNWTVIKRWKAVHSSNTISFDVCVDELNASILRWVTLETHQSQYLFILASHICDHIKKEADRRANPLPPINRAKAGKVQDPLYEFVNGFFFGFEPKFNSIPET